MQIFSRQHSARRRDQVKEIRSELDAAQKYGHKDGHEFICAEDIQKIWTLQKIQTLSRGLPWDKPELHERAYQEFKSVLSLLAWIHWDDWADFGRVFLEHFDRGQLDRTDRYLPFGPATRLLSDSARNIDFLKRQYIFIPVELAEEGPNQFAKNKDEYDASYRLPFLKTEDIKGGATGDVSKALIAPNYFIYEHGQTNTKPMWVAIKRIQRSDQNKTKNFVTEQKALRTFKQCLRKHDNIMHSYMSFAHGADFVIISPLADLDLAIFFSGIYPSFPRRQREFTPFDLFQEAACLAGALSFLHNGLELRGSKIACAHLDFKPDNILVRWTINSQSTSFGQWLIHDFGTSRIKESSEETGALAPGDFLTRFSLTKAQRSPSTYQAPEVQNNTERTTGRESDMWSLGCTVAIALAFSLGGPDFATDLLDANYNSTLLDPVPNDWFYTKASGETMVKVATREWLMSRASERSEERWIERIIDLIFKMLVVTPTERVKAEEVQDALNCICSEESLRMRLRCRWPTPPTPGPSRGSVRYRNQDSGLIPVEAPTNTNGPNSITTPPWPQWGNSNPTLSSTINHRQNASNFNHQSTPYSPTSPWYGSTTPNPYRRSLPGQPASPLSPPPVDIYGEIPGSPSYQTHYYPGSNLSNDQNIEFPMRKPSIVRSDTNNLTTIYTPSTLPNSARMSQSDESSSLDKGKGPAAAGHATYSNLSSPLGSSKSVVCGISNRVAFMSISSVLVHNFRFHNNWTIKKPPKTPDAATFGFYPPKPIDCLAGFAWDLISLCSDWLVLRANNGADCRILRYQCSRSSLDNLGVALEFWTETPFSTNKYGMPAPDAVNAIATGVLEIKVNSRGDVIFMLDAGLCLYSSKLGLHSLVIEGQLRRACFSSDGNHVFAWTKSNDYTYGPQNRWYIWNVNSTTTPLLNSTSSWTAARRPGYGKDSLIFPFSTYFAAFEIPDRLYIIGKDRYYNPIIQLKSPVESVSAGVTYGTESHDSTSHGLILVQQDSNPRVTNLPLLAQVQNSTPSKLHDLQLGFNTQTHGVAIFRDDAAVYVVISHPKGVIERRKISI